MFYSEIVELVPENKNLMFIVSYDREKNKWHNVLSVSINMRISLIPLEFRHQGPVVQSVVSLTSSLRVISLTVLADSVHNILIFFAEKM